MKYVIYAAAVTVFWLLAGCGANSSLEEPPTIRYGEDLCDECGMIISETRYSASYVTNTGEVRHFDDLGSMLAYDARHQEPVHFYWVHDFASEAWVKASEATFVTGDDLRTPMSWGLIAFASQADAEQFAGDNNGTTLTWAALQEAVAAGNINPATLSSHLQEHHHTEMEHE